MQLPLRPFLATANSKPLTTNASYSLHINGEVATADTAFNLAKGGTNPEEPITVGQESNEPLPTPPVQWPRNQTFDTQHIALNLRFDWEKSMVLGEATLRLKPYQENLREVELDAADFQVNYVKLNNTKDLAFTVSPTKLKITLDRTYQPEEEISLTVKYQAQPKQGLRFIKPSADAPNKRYQIWSQGEAETNHYWFPCYDYPNDRATSELTATVDSKYTVISNGSLVNTKKDPQTGLTTYYWRTDQPFPSYLVSVIVGEFAELRREADGVPIIHYVYPEKLEQARRTFENVPQMLRFFNQQLNVPYPYSKYAETTVQEFGGGMENVSATTLSDNTVRDARALFDSEDGLSAHELAHQWFGDLVTCRDWSELWLNEGFASILAAVWLEHSRGAEGYIEDRLRTHQFLIERYRKGFRRPVATRRYFDPDRDLFDENSYARPQMVLHMLRQMLGEKAFWRSLTHYLQTNRNRSVTTADLVRAIAETTGQQLDWFFDQWIYKMGQPDLVVESQYLAAQNQVKLTVKQTQKPDPKRPWFVVPEVFRFPVEIEITTEKGRQLEKVFIDQATQEFVFNVPSTPLIINFDRGNHILKSLQYPRSRQELVYQLRNDVDVTGRWRAAHELVAFNDESTLTTLAAAAKEDSSWLIRREAVATLATMRHPIARQALLNAIQDSTWQVRETATQGLAQLADMELISQFVTLAEKDPSLRVAATAIEALGQINSPATLPYLLQFAEQPSWQNRLARVALAGLQKFNDPRTFNLALRYATPENDNFLRSQALIVLGKQGKGNKLAVELLQKALQARPNFLRYQAVQALNLMGDAVAIKVLEDFVAKNAQERPQDNDFRGFVEGILKKLKTTS
jgi:aminopeptidase N